MIVAGTSPLIYIDLGKDEPGMTLQRQDQNEWVNVRKDGKVVKSPVDIDELPAGVYRLTWHSPETLVTPSSGCFYSKADLRQYPSPSCTYAYKSA